MAYRILIALLLIASLFAEDEYPYFGDMKKQLEFEEKIIIVNEVDEKALNKILYDELIDYTDFELFKEDIINSLNFIDQNEKIINDILYKYSFNKKLAISIIFPELVRYSFLRDYIENKFNEILYVNWGNYYADFSIGYFQMKPSFAERIDNKISSSIFLKQFSDTFNYPNNYNKKEIRMQRLNRLNDFEWQLRYLALFIKIINFNVNERYGIDNAEKISYYANCYNSGYWNDEIKFNKLNKKRTYPYGLVKFKKNTHTYTELSIFYFNYLNSINN